jgi:HK97 family phage major capsid protein
MNTDAEIMGAISSARKRIGSGETLSPEEGSAFRTLCAEADRRNLPGFGTNRIDIDTRGARSDSDDEREMREVQSWVSGDESRSAGGELSAINLDASQVAGQSIFGAGSHTGNIRTFKLPSTQEHYEQLAAEKRDNTSLVNVSITGGTAGGYTVPPDFWHNLQIAMRAYGGLWDQFKLVRTDSGAPMSWPTNNPTAVVGTLLTEDTQITPSSSYTFGLGQLMAWTVVGPLTLVTLQLEEDSAFDTGAFVGARLGEAIGRELSALAWSGTGSSQPLGLITALAAGTSITPGTSTGSGSSGGGYLALAAANAVKNFAGSTTELAANTISPMTALQMIEAVDPAYWPTCAFYMNAAQAMGIRAQVDANGRPLLNLDHSFDDKATIGTMYNFPVIVDNGAPNATASTVGGPTFGSMQHAMVRREVRDIRIARLVERFADYLCVAYLGWHRVDSRSNDLRAAVTVKYNTT